MSDQLTISYISSSIVLALLVVYLVRSIFRANIYKLRHVPTVGGTSLPLLSMIGAIRMTLRGAKIHEEVYQEYKGRAYKYAQIKSWHVIVSGHRLLGEFFRAPEDALSVVEGSKELIQSTYTMGNRVVENPYHAEIVRSQLTRSLVRILPDMQDEVIVAFGDLLVLEGDGWTDVPINNMTLTVVSRVSNRAFVGLPTCRIPEYCKLTQDHAANVVKSAIIINLFPAILQPIVGRLASHLNTSITASSKFLGPIIEERLRMREQYGDDWPGKPVDVMQQLLDVAPEDELSVEPQAARLLLLNFAAIHTTSMTFIQALYYIASNPNEFLSPLREEVEALVAQYGFNKNSLDRMHKLDSFVRETTRMSGIFFLVATRCALKDFTFSDGTLVPAGTYVSVPSHAINHDDAVYPDPERFNPWRFSDLRQASEDERTKHQFVSVSLDYVSFGYGRHACPGRFFAATEIKTMLAHVLTTYDVKLPHVGAVPPTTTFGAFRIPNAKARVLFRKRQT